MMVGLSPEAPWSEFEEQLALVERAQLGCVQLSVRRGAGLDMDLLLRALDALYQREVEVAAIGWYVNLLRPDDREFFTGNDLGTFDVIVRAMSETGGRPVVTWDGTYGARACDGHPDNHTEASYERVKAQARPLVDRLVAVGGSLLIEPYYRHVLGSAFQLTRFCQDLGSGTGVVLDPINLVTPETFPDRQAHLSAVITALADYAVIVHLKDLDLNTETNSVVYPGPGKGALDYTWYVRTLAKAADGAPGILEHLQGDAVIDARAQVERSLG